MCSTVKIVANGVGRGEVFVDGVKIKGARGVETKTRAGEATLVAIELVAPSLDEVEFTEAGIIVSGVCMPASVEMALYRHLLDKHGDLQVDVTSMGSENREFVAENP